MIESDSLDRITINSNDILTFENNYYNHKNNNKLEKNIIRLFNYYKLSKNQNGGNNNNLSSQIKKRLYKKIVELGNNFIGGVDPVASTPDYWSIIRNGLKNNVVKPIALMALSFEQIKEKVKNKFNNNDIKNRIINNIIKTLDDTIDNKIENVDMQALKKIFIGPVDNYNEWLKLEMREWVNTNKDDIYDKIKEYVFKFIDTKAIKVKTPEQQVPEQQVLPEKQAQTTLWDAVLSQADLNKERWITKK